MSFERFQRNQRIFARIDKLRIKAWHWLVLAVLMVAVDYVGGPTIQFPFLFLIPVMLAAWFTGSRAGLILALLLPAARLLYGSAAWGDWLTLTAVANCMIRIAVFSLIALLTSFAAGVRVLRGLIDICAHCRKVMDAQGKWSTVEDYVERHSEAAFTHGICPECARIYFPDHVPQPGVAGHGPRPSEG